MHIMEDEFGHVNKLCKQIASACVCCLILWLFVTDYKPASQLWILLIITSQIKKGALDIQFTLQRKKKIS